MLCLLLVSPAKGQRTAHLCTSDLEHITANCSAEGLTRIPYGLHNNIKSLDLSSNNFPLLYDNSFISYSYLTNLNLGNNSMRELKAKSLNNLYYLDVLDLTNNLLTAVPQAALEEVNTSLRNLSLAGNKISQIPAYTFINLTKLEYLDLSGNSIYRVHYHGFNGLSSLKFLKLRHNALHTLPVDAFRDFPKDMIQVQLYGNRWLCDCQLRWLREWMNRTDAAVWNTTGYQVRCDGPSVIRGTSLDSRSMDELACEVVMKTSSATREVQEGADTTVLCKYFSVPREEAIWLKNSDIIDVEPVRDQSLGSGPAAIAVIPSPTPPTATRKDKSKYQIRTWVSVDNFHKEPIQTSELLIRDFRYEDIARYKCFVQNIRGVASIEYPLTLEGVAFDSVTVSQPAGHVAKTGGGVDTHSIVIAVAVVCGIVLIVAIGVLILCSVNRVQKRRREKREAIEETVKQHFIETSEVVTNGDASSLHNHTKSMEDRLDGTHEDQRSFSNGTNHSAATTLKRPFDLAADGEEAEPSYIFQQPGSPFNNGNTYVSFGSELTDPGDYNVIPMGTLGRGGQHPSQPHNPRHMAGSRGYESSHAGSGTPLLDRGTPSILDSDEPIEDYSQYPVYDSLTNTLQRPNGETSSIYGGSLHHPLHRNEGIYGGSLRQGEGIYGGSLHQYPHRPPNHGEPIYGGSLRNGTCSQADPAKRLSSFQYPPTSNFPLPRTPTNARPSSTLPAPVPRYADYRNGYSSAESYSPRLDHHNPVPPVSPSPHNRTMPHHMDYRDYREMHYPTTTPPPHRMNAGQKSMSVGNLGYPQPFSAPRKPPRLFQSREYMELTPTENREVPMTIPTTTVNGSADYITSPEAQQYGKNYGITPGTPV
ncbi:leucine-rich repeat and immunoglobulin-like domain-containing nogo receptor-interacting protein 2 [Elysia marginata]|uniref:Leucine-rich repeat and immunoglobulin-like domain-containing nogo receptor-interacting protein 2 n=1 Tax=Elysia marginata TaxID=1093978 RepID=A0AAV4HFU1_9GAST|nr:leucine-rich repeat and immunoglobulin-like domain-containing nogo receptor-interacting protein 2 [Elysia marginata]